MTNHAEIGNPQKWIITKWSNPNDRTDEYSDVTCPNCYGSEICAEWSWAEAEASEELFDTPPAGWDVCDHCGAFGADG